MKAKKGFIEGTLPQLLLVLISFAVIAMIISNIFSGAGGIQEKLCLAVPFFCGGADSSEDLETSKKSTETLMCAINSVLKGQKITSDVCADHLVETGPTTGHATGMQTGGNKETAQKTTFDCNIQFGSSGPILTTPTTTQTQQTSDIPPGTCKVTNFYLPERFNGWTGTAKEYISGFGDPTFLVYFQSFPTGEDSAWSSEESWFNGIGTVMFASMCVGHFVGPVIKAGKWILSTVRPTRLVEATLKTGEKVVDKLSWLKTMLRKAGRSEDEINTIINEKVIITSEKSRETLLSVLRNYFTDDFMKTVNLKVIENYRGEWTAYKSVVQRRLSEGGVTLSKEIWDAIETTFRNPTMEGAKDLSRYIPKQTALELTKASKIEGVQKLTIPVAAHAMTYAAIDGSAAYLASILDKQIRKTVPSPGKVVIDSPFKDIITYDINYLKKPVPIILNKPGRDKPSFYLASPCKTDLSIKMAGVYCSEYIYKKGSNHVECKVVTDDDVYNYYYQGVRLKIPIFGIVLGKNKDEVLSNVPTCGSVIYSGDRTMFKDNNDDEKWDEITLLEEWEDSYIEEDVTIKDNNYDGIFDEAKIVKPDSYTGKKRTIVLTGTGGKEDSNEDGIFEKEFKIDNSGSMGSETISILENGKELCKSKMEYPYYVQGLFTSNRYSSKIYVNYPTQSTGTTCTMNHVVSFRLEGNEIGKWSEIYVGIFPLQEDPQILKTVLKDSNGDGKWEIKKEGSEDDKPEIEITDSDGDVFRSEWCLSDAIEITADENKIDEYKVTINGKDYNFCYAKNNQLLSDLVTAGSFLADAFAKKFTGGFAGWLIGTAADCTLTYVNAKIKTGIWPER